MDISLLLGYTGAVLTGLALGLLGGGGALLSIPVLVYLFHIEASVATGYSLFLVGVTALSGAVQNIRNHTVDYKVTLSYGIPSLLTVFSVRRFVIPAMPDILFRIGTYPVDKNHFILLVFCIVLFGAAYKMIRANEEEELASVEGKIYYFNLGLYAIVIGGFLGLVGAGGGFLIIPALVYFAKLPMKKAVGTSLVLVAVNSFIGFMGDLAGSHQIDWIFLLTFAGFSISGILAGGYFSRFIRGNQLKKSFGWFILLIGIYMLVKETFLK